MAFQQEKVPLKLADDANVHSQLTYPDCQDDGLTFSLLITLTENAYGKPTGNSQFFDLRSDGVTLTVTDKQTNSVVAWAIGTEPSANVPTRLFQAIGAVQSVVHSLRLNAKISGAPRG